MGDPDGGLSEQTGRLRHCVERLQAGDDTARADLVNRACDQLRRLTRGLLRDYPRVRRWEQTDDVLQNAALRLWQALESVTPRSLPEFFSLAALYVRRELIDLAREFYGPEGLGAHHASTPDGSSGPLPVADPADSACDPARLAAWTEFHEKAGQLPAEERQVFDLLWYQGLTQPEAASLLGVDERTIRRRWRSARVGVYAACNGVQSWDEPGD